MSDITLLVFSLLLVLCGVVCVQPHSRQQDNSIVSVTGFIRLHIFIAYSVSTVYILRS